MNKIIPATGRIISMSVIILFLMIGRSNAQTNATNYKNNPEWIKMIDNPNTNYFEAIKAYETYWSFHEKPENEEEEFENNAKLLSSEKMNEKEQKELEERKREKDEQVARDSNRELTDKELLKLEEKREMTYQCKRFENWIREVKPYVHSDGRILSKEERMEIYYKQVEDQRKQNNK